MIEPIAQRATALDANDELAAFRAEFHVPQHDGRDQAYFCGNSLGLQPKATRQAVIDELDDWARLGVEGHFRGRHPWMPYHEFVRAGLAHVAGAMPAEVVAMNTLYPTKTWTAPNPHACLKEGDTPSWFFFLPRGGNDPADPTKPGWGGQYAREPDGWYRDLPAQPGFEPREAVSRWRPEFQRDFAARMRWCQ